jgi:hypothetical protein
LVETGEGLDLRISSGILLSVSNAVEEFGIFTSGDVIRAVNIRDLEDLESGRLARVKVNLLSNEVWNLAVVEFSWFSHIAVFRNFLKAKELGAEDEGSNHDTREDDP